jgi:hypothetical protein
VTSGQRLFTFGDGLDQTPLVFLIPPGGPEQNISAWKVPDPDPKNPQFQTHSRITLDVPAVSPPAAGVYQIRAGTSAGYRTNSTPVSFSARVDITIAPPNPPLLTPAGATFTITGAGFVSGDTELLLDTIPLQEEALGPGAFTVSATSISFQLPTNLQPGLYTVRVRVAKVESDPSWWIQKV